MSKGSCESGGKGEVEENVLGKWLAERAAAKLIGPYGVRRPGMEVVDGLRLKTELEDEDEDDGITRRKEIEVLADSGFVMNPSAQRAKGLPKRVRGRGTTLHKCSCCSKVFLELANFKIHVWEHFPTLLSLSNPNGSELRVHGNKEHFWKRFVRRTHICPVSTCPWRFEKKAHLLRHVERQHGPSNWYMGFVCPLCGLRLSRPDHGKRHMRNVHRLIFVSSMDTDVVTRRSSRIQKKTNEN